MGYLFVFILSCSLFGYLFMFVYPHFLSPVKLRDKENGKREYALVSIKSKVSNLKISDWQRIKDNENPLVFIYLFQMAEVKQRQVVKEKLKLPFDPMISKKIVSPSQSTLDFIDSYLSQVC